MTMFLPVLLQRSLVGYANPVRALMACRQMFALGCILQDLAEVFNQLVERIMSTGGQTIYRIALGCNVRLNA